MGTEACTEDCNGRVAEWRSRVRYIVVSQSIGGVEHYVKMNISHIHARGTALQKARHKRYVCIGGSLAMTRRRRQRRWTVTILPTRHVVLVAHHSSSLKRLVGVEAVHLKRWKSFYPEIHWHVNRRGNEERVRHVGEEIHMSSTTDPRSYLSTITKDEWV